MCSKAIWMAALAGLLIVGSGCGTASQPPATSALTPTDVPSPTATREPTRTPEPTETPRPTHTPRPTPTTAPTPTSTPLVTPQPTPTATVEPTSIGAITPERIGEEVTVEGTVLDTSSFSEGFKFTLDDGTGQIVLLMWHEVYDDCWHASKINRGAEVRATGKIGQYEGEMQLQPSFGGDVKATEGATAQAPRRDIESLSSDDEGQRVMIDGEVVRTEGLPNAVKVFVGDGSGEIVVFIWRNVLNRIDGNTALGKPGSRVRVVGTVEIYRNNLELVPTLPNDVTVLGTP